MIKRISMLLLTLLFCLAGCRSADPITANQVNQPVLGHLQTVDRIITIHGGQPDVTYTVATRDGRILGECLTLVQLREQFPSLVQPVETGMADLDARLDSAQNAHR
ncbi:hypothetical protein ACFL6U_11700 [Planctomycetota bacterium]